MIQFVECPHSGYKARTMENASADVTIAIAKNFTTAGEVLTATSVKNLGKGYIPVKYDFIDDINQLTSVLHRILEYKTEVINIAGNGIYTLKEDQELTDLNVLIFLTRLFTIRLNTLNIPFPLMIRSGGQTGIDEAGLKAAVKLGIPALCYAPKGWTFRNINSKDISNEQLFKARFL
jgi:hypothetical protein